MHRTSTIRIAGLIASLLLPLMAAWGQEAAPGERLLNSDPQKLLDLMQGHRGSVAMTSIGDMERREVRNAPVQVQVITARQIKASMARDLFEALELVPGISFARMEDDGFGLGTHGLWAGEGRYLFLLNGEPLNENDLGSYSLGARIPLVNVERIEVVLGPASSLHGGMAGLGVVNIVTRTADMGSASRIHLGTGYSNGALTNSQAIISGANRLSRDQDISYFAAHGRGHRSNVLVQLPDSTWMNYADSTEMVNNTFQLSYGWKGLRAHIAYLEQINIVSDRPYSIQHRDVLLGTSFNHNFNRRFNLQAGINYHDQLPGFRSNTALTDLLSTNTGNIGAGGQASLGYKPKEWLNLRVGSRFNHRASRFLQRSGETVFSLNDQRWIAMDELALHGLLAISTKLGSFHAAYQYEQNSLAGTFQAPRLSYVLVHGPFHGKLIWARGYRIPALMNLEHAIPDTPLMPEAMESKDIELGLRLPHGVSLTVNAFRTTVLDPIALTGIPAGGQGYTNGTDLETDGVDARISVETKRLTVLGGFGKNRPSTVAGQIGDAGVTAYPAFHFLPANRGYLVVAYDLLEGLTLRGKATWRDRTSSLHTDHSGELQLMDWPEELVLSGGVSIKPGKMPRLAIDLGCRNLTDTKRVLLGISGTEMPFVLNGREFSLGLTYNFNQ